VDVRLANLVVAQPLSGDARWHAAGQDLRNSMAAAGEHLMHHGLKAVAIGICDERIGPAADRHEATVDAGPRPKRRCGNPSH
jgi:hypothetical protein